MVSGSGSQVCDVLIDGEKIERVAAQITWPEANVVDVTGKLLFPGFIDAHTHFDLDVCNTTTADNFDTGTRSAIRGGTTMVVDRLPPTGRACNTGWTSGTKKPTADQAATTAST